jgi:hypothetical protein
MYFLFVAYSKLFATKTILNKEEVKTLPLSFLSVHKQGCALVVSAKIMPVVKVLIKVYNSSIKL